MNNRKTLKGFRKPKKLTNKELLADNRQLMSKLYYAYGKLDMLANELKKYKEEEE